MDGMRISEAADRTGFSPATLRYYEELGVVPAPGRTEAGYRVYDERAVGRLAFVARAKDLGLSLDEVGDLTELWEGDECAPVQERLQAFVSSRLARTREQISALSDHAVRLEAVAEQLADDPAPGPCDDRCACNAEPAPVRAGAGIACTLDAAEVPGRLAEWEAVAGRVVGREPLDGGIRVRFPVEEGLAATLAALAQAEQGCCAFFEFAVGITAGAVTLDVTGPADAAPVIAGLFGTAS